MYQGRLQRVLLDKDSATRYFYEPYILVRLGQTKRSLSLLAWVSETNIHLRSVDSMAAQPLLRELLGVGVVYLGGLNYLFPVRERVPVVSATGISVGSLDVAITPYVEAAVRRRQSQNGAVRRAKS